MHLSIIFIILNVADVLLTQHALINGLSEGNPILAGNMNLLIPIKIAGIFIIIIMAIACEKIYKTKNAIIAPVILMGLVVIWNIIQIIKSGAV